MPEYGSAITWVVIILTVAITGMLYMLLGPMIDTFITMGLANSGCDPGSMAVIHDTIMIYFPLTLLLSLMVYGYRRSGRGA